MPKFYQLIFLNLFLFSSMVRSYGQQLTAPVTSSVAAPRITRDTARAVGTLFAKHRTGGII
ncbi:MAG: hypothetical protein ACRYFK_09050 [Janthinobacterium lividum]